MQTAFYLYPKKNLLVIGQNQSSFPMDLNAPVVYLAEYFSVCSLCHYARPHNVCASLWTFHSRHFYRIIISVQMTNRNGT